MITAIREKEGTRHRILIGKRYEVVIPRQSARRLGIKPGEEFEMVESKKALLLVPKKKIPQDQQWYYTPRWQKMMREAFEDIKHGRIVGPFETAEEAIRELRSSKV